LNRPRSLRLELTPSPLLASLIVGLHAAAAVSAILVVPGHAGLALGAALLALGLAAAWARALMRSSGAVRAIELEGPNAATLELASGERLPAKVAERRYVSRFLVNLPILAPARRTLLVTPDMLGIDSFRRLRIWALWGKLAGVAGKQLPD
jgi:hypothetical protein